ncbi:DUF362 domain-containing protein [Anaerotalea alkaliphila]|uniref:DUF362 domain-containing protein n=1 Tax=Anaerotalea alkaliphila TaxID=2662126 RepID=A0A7X5HV29_9FIRM|nr:DUF362 domain-containing protein [Anaerotalea alkaliphila]
MAKVSAVECNSYELGEVYLSLKEALKEIGFQVPRGKTVFLKPNIMSQNRPEQHTVTHFAVVDGLCRLLKEHECSILIGDSIAFYQDGLTRRAFETTGINRVAEKYGARLVAFEEEELVPVPVCGTGPPTLYLPKVLLEADLVVDVCKLKTHSGMRLSGAVKNLLGCLPGGYKQLVHIWTENDFALSDVLLDVLVAVKPALSVMDAIYALDGGPSALGRPLKASRILASTSAPALDAVACRIMGYDPDDISYLVRARERGLLDSSEAIAVEGDVPLLLFRRLVKGPLPLRKKKDSILVTQTYVTPVVVQSKCTRCGDCIRACPVDAIRKEGERVLVDPDRCIRCYRCLHVCPQGAVEARGTPVHWLLRFLRWVAGI